MRRLLFFQIMVGLPIWGWGQPPNNTCAGAIQIPVPVSNNCTPTGNYSTVGATNSQSTSCMSSLYRDTWYKFTPTDYQVTAQVSGFWSTAKIELFDACGGSSISCHVGGNTFAAVWSSLTAGNTYYFRIGVLASQGEGMINLCLSQYAYPTLSVTTTPACSGNDGTVTATVVGGQSPYDFSLSNGDFILGDIDGIVTFTGLSPGTYDIYMTDWYGADDTEIFDIQSTPPLNDECTGAITLTMGNVNCTPVAYSTGCSTVSSQSQPCLGGLQDAWFSTTATQSGYNFSTGSLPAGGNYWLEIYSGSCSNLNYIECIEELQPISNYFINSSAGAYYLRLLYFGNEGPVEICVWESGVMPISLLSLQAQPQKNNTQLNWRTASEAQNAYFDIEHSLNGVSFEAIGQVPGQGTTTELHDYDFTHERPGPGTHYYRLRQVDLDGHFEYSKTISAMLDSDAIAIYPNPTVGILNISGKDLDDATFTVTDMLGTVLLRGNLTEGEMDVSFLMPGTYLLTVITGNKVITQRIIKN